MLSQKLQDDLITAYQKVYEEKRGHASGSSDIEKQASQLASDVRYKARGKAKPGASKEELRKLFLSLLGSSPAPQAVKAMAKDKLLGEEKVQEGMGQGMFDKNKIGGAGRQIKKKAAELPKFKNTDNPDFKKVFGNPKKGKETPPEVKKDMEDKNKQFGVTSEGSAYGITKGDGMSFPERLKKKAKEKKKKVSEGFKEIDKKKENKMYRRAGNLARQSISSDNQKEKYDTAKKSANIVSAITRQKEKKRFDEIGKTPAADLRNDSYEPEGELVDERAELKHLNYGNAVVGQKKGKEQTVKSKKAIPTGGDGTAYMGEAKKAKKDYDGDGKIESGTQEFLGSRDKAIKKAIAKRRGRVKEGFSAWRIDLDFNEQVKKEKGDWYLPSPQIA